MTKPTVVVRSREVALALAEAFGLHFAVVRVREFNSPFSLGHYLLSRYDLLILDDFDDFGMHPARLKSLLTEPEVLAHRRGLDPIMVPSPNYILVIKGELWGSLSVGADDRRFLVLE